MTRRSTLTTFVASDGENLAVQDWPLGPRQRGRGTVLLVHGLGEHAGRYDALATRLNARGWTVRGYDQYGHGESGGPRGGLTSVNRLLDDLADLVDATRARMPVNTPLILLGHSLGGLVAASFVALAMRPVQALVLSSPALQINLNLAQKALLSVLLRCRPDARVGNGLNPDFLSHNPAVVAAYRADKQVHDRVSVRLVQFMAQAGPATLAEAAHWRVPTLLLYAGDDRLVNPDGSRAFARLAPPAQVTAMCFAAMYHEVFNEPDSQGVYRALNQWLNARF